MTAPDAPATDDEATKTARAYKRGFKSNAVGLLVLAAVGWALSLNIFVCVALVLQLGVFFAHGLPFRSEKFYDLSGSLTHLAVVMTALSEPRVRSPRQVFVAIASVVWMTRLGTFLYNRILRDGKDGRFDAIRPYWPWFMAYWTIQALWVSLIQLPVLLLNTVDDRAPVGYLDVVVMCIWFAAFFVESASDSQKMVFRDDPANKNKYITTGLWRFSRHPNYFGEILMWVAMATLCSLASSGAVGGFAGRLHFAWLSPAFTSLLLLKVTGVPLVERAGLKKWGDDPKYLHYMTCTSCIVPWFAAPAYRGAAEKRE